MNSRIKETVDLIRDRLDAFAGRPPLVGVILGSGLSALADSFQERIVIPLGDLPHFPSPTVPGHVLNLIAGYAEGVPAVAVQGRLHLYEGYSSGEVAFPVRVLGALGVDRLIVTNAAGGINPVFRPGDLMLITDHINLTGQNPLTGCNADKTGPRFPDMSEAYDAAMRDIALKAAKQERITIREGVYIGLAGPSYETPAEIRMCRILGGDAVGMSTIPEVIVANQMGIRVLGISCITNMAAGMLPRKGTLPQKLTHEAVIETTEKAGGKFQSLLRAILPRIADGLANC